MLLIGLVAEEVPEALEVLEGHPVHLVPVVVVAAAFSASAPYVVS